MGEAPKYFLYVSEKCEIEAKPTLVAIAVIDKSVVSSMVFAFSQRSLLRYAIGEIPKVFLKVCAK